VNHRYVCVIACAFASIALSARAQTTTVITHGFTTGSKGAWVEGVSAAIIARAGGIGSVYRYSGATGAWTRVPEAGGDGSTTNVVLIYNWVPESAGVSAGPNWNYVQAAGDVLYAMLRDAKYAVGSSGPNDLVTGRSLHLIGHSRGACLISETARRFAVAGITVEQLTFHDPHPVNGTLDARYDLEWGDPVPVRWNTVTWADNYWRADGGGLINGLDFDGIPLANVHNLNLNESALNCCANSFAHLDVHLWYHGTVDLTTPCSDGEQTITAPMRTTWWQEAPAALGYTLRGYYYSVLGGGSATRPAIPPGTAPPAGSAPILYNGDFPLNPDSQATYAGWTYHGGSVGGQITLDAGDGYLRLGPGAAPGAAAHNRFFFPTNATRLVFNHRTFTAGSGPVESLTARLNDEDGGSYTLGSIDLLAAGGWINGHIMNIPANVPRGRNHTLTFQIVSAGTIEAVVGVDDVLIDVAPACPADINDSGSVGIEDLLAVIAAWGSGPGPADVNGDGTVNIADLLAVIAAWGVCP
jgi:hypothetical protein